MVAATLSTGETRAELVLGFIGFGTAILVILSPLPVFRAIWRTHQVGQTKAYPYLAVLLNCAIWVVFGIPAMKQLAHHGRHRLLEWAGVPLMGANCLGVVVELVYVSIIIRFAVGQRRAPVVGLGLVVIASGIVAALLLATHWPRTFVGHMAMYSGIGTYAVPVYTAYLAYKANDPSQICVYQASASLANGVVWIAYACVNHVRAFVFFPNLTAVFCASGQLILREWIKRKVARQAAAARRAAELELAAAERRPPAPQDLEAGLGGGAGGGGVVQDLVEGGLVVGGGAGGAVSAAAGGGGVVQDLVEGGLVVGGGAGGAVSAAAGGGGVVQDLVEGGLVVGGGAGGAVSAAAGGGGVVQDLVEGGLVVGGGAGGAVSAGGGGVVKDLEDGGVSIREGTGNEAAPGMGGVAGAQELALPEDEVLVLPAGYNVENQGLAAATDDGLLMLPARDGDNNDVENQVLDAAADNGLLVLPAAGEDQGNNHEHGGGAVVKDDDNNKTITTAPWWRTSGKTTRTTAHDKSICCYRLDLSNLKLLNFESAAFGDFRH